MINILVGVGSLIIFLIVLYILGIIYSKFNKQKIEYDDYWTIAKNGFLFFIVCFIIVVLLGIFSFLGSIVMLAF